MAPAGAVRISGYVRSTAGGSRMGKAERIAISIGVLFFVYVVFVYAIPEASNPDTDLGASIASIRESLRRIGVANRTIVDAFRR